MDGIINSGKSRLIAETSARLRAAGHDEVADFAARLYARAAAEDIVHYAATDLARLAQAAFARLGAHRPGTHTITIEDIDVAGEGPRGRGLTLLEVVNDDMPFLVDSIVGALQDVGADVRLLLHPVLAVSGDSSDVRRESLVHIHLARLPDEAAHADLARRLEATLGDVRRAVNDWQAMRAAVVQAVADYRAAPPPLPDSEVAEAIAFLEWLADDNFTFLGLREYDVELADGPGRRILHRDGTGLGVLTDPEFRILRRGREFVEMTPEIRDFMMRPEALFVIKANVKSRVHRRAYLDCVGIKHYLPDGRLVGEIRVAGLFTSTAYTRPARTIPYLRRKVAAVLERAGFDAASHSARTLANVIETYPRDELFQIDTDQLYEFALAILELDERPRIRVLARLDRFDRFVSVLVFVPRERYTTEVRARIGDYLARVYAGRVSAFYPAFLEGGLTRVHFIIGRDEGQTPEVARAELETAVAALVRTWGDEFAALLHDRFAPLRARALAGRFSSAFSVSYRDRYRAPAALDDIARVERLTDERPTTITFGRGDDLAPHQCTLKLFQRGAPIPLTRRVPVLENLGFEVIDEQTYEIQPADGGHVVLHDMTLARPDGQPIDLDTLADPLRALFMAVWLKRAESDALNALAIHAGLAWREIAILRTLSRYLQQAGIAYGQHYMADALVRHAGTAARLVALFLRRFDPGAADRRADDEAAIAALIEADLEAVTSLDDDTILRRFLGLIRATNRTNFFQIAADGQPKDVISLKLDPARVEGLPAPRPHAEIWVYSPRVEGVHLRFGMVARGGLRWSDRPQDFRTEVLGLVKAQQVKNAVIVPVGAKGGFFPKQLPDGGGREAVFAEGTAAYKIFIESLLDVTDDIEVGGAIVPPESVVRHDRDDPYLVVAADKGTATFSDTANAIADARGFWLSDAFASGGSVGYDHKKMGITARGAWEAVKRHFREIDIDIQKTPFTVAGVGDMSGDVFGNGMLLSPAIHLVAAFDHRDIFIDPDPDAAAGLAERRRLFALPRSSWQDYDRSLISPGGGVFSRSAKSISLSPEIQAVLGFARDRATPAEVMRAILRAPVDLMWFGGIGTYVRGPGESDAEAGDKANDALRIAAGELRAKVVGEGANLGLTQRARIAYAAGGGRVNSDAIDNSAGVNSSDVEVNIKIALRRAVLAGRLQLADRNTLLASMTDDVAALVLRNNYLQTLAISMTAQRGAEDFGYQRRLMQTLEERGLLDRAVEYLPDDAALAQREKDGRLLTRPELGVLLAYAKIVLFDDLLATAVPDDPYLAGELYAYFPPAMREAFSDDIAHHRLKREIVATRLANAVINRGGPAFVVRIADQTGAAPAGIVRAFLAARDAFGLPALFADVDALDAAIPGAAQLELYGRIQDLMLQAVTWLLRNTAVDGEDLAALVGRFRPGIEEISAALDLTALPEEVANAVGETVARLVDAGVPAPLARRAALLPVELRALDAVVIAERAERPLAVATAALYQSGARFEIGRIEALARRLVVRDYYDGLALDRARRTLGEAHRRMAIAIAAAGPTGADIDAWVWPRREQVARTSATIAAILAEGEPTVARLTIVAGLLADLADSG
ncbi:NAD-glutamate dehydrogenase [Methylobrevis albus]|uniref:NAD-glutamate dehydrogenase n=1 Tax=Methylobrevis albus TaxID=2793297 RepID=A0A931HYU8_9HYPH|nr:NAD-glutamate dehydrogenase [Methylobrevis albus]MBH0237257.1 NAD-glutamate dehydrogenase [Methylobrevis albus]